jgi:hypothetical protein
MGRTVLFLKESANGHDTELVEENKVAEEIKKELDAGKWITVEKTDGSSTVLTSPPPPVVEEKKAGKEEKKADDWQNVFGKKADEVKPSEIKSVTSTSKIKGG